MSKRRPVPVEFPPALAFGAFAVGALAVGALAIGYLAIRRLAVKRAHFHRLEIDNLIIHRLDESRPVVVLPRRAGAEDDPWANPEDREG